MIWEPFDPVSYLAHVGLGFVALVAGITALSVTKGSPLHIRAGKLFAIMMIPVALSTIVFMFHKFLPVALVMAIAVLYFIPSAVLAFSAKTDRLQTINRLLIIIPVLLFVVTAIQSIRFQFIDTAPKVGPIMLAMSFGFIVFQDIKDWRIKDLQKNLRVRRHLVRMVFSVLFAVMAVIRIGINFGLTLEQTVIVPTLFSWMVIAYFYTKYPVKRMVPI